MLADEIAISSPGPSGSSTSTTVTPGGVDRTARMGELLDQGDVVVGVGGEGALPVLEQGERPVLGDATGLVLVPAVHVGPSPRHLAVLGVDALVELVVHVLADLERRVPPAQQQLDAADEVPHPALGEVDDAAVDHDVGVRSVEAEEVREARDRDARGTHARRRSTARAARRRRGRTRASGVRKFDAWNPVP